jgi:hypothetical protein
MVLGTATIFSAPMPTVAETWTGSDELDRRINRWSCIKLESLEIKQWDLYVRLWGNTRDLKGNKGTIIQKLSHNVGVPSMCLPSANLSLFPLEISVQWAFRFMKRLCQILIRILNGIKINRFCVLHKKINNLVKDCRFWKIICCSTSQRYFTLLGSRVFIILLKI